MLVHVPASICIVETGALWSVTDGGANANHRGTSSCR